MGRIRRVEDGSNTGLVSGEPLGGWVPKCAMWCQVGGPGLPWRGTYGTLLVGSDLTGGQHARMDGTVGQACIVRYVN